ncbi:DUF2889 domain-containing protein [Geobacter pickeringii]|uniref:DUF2889 domain-containing protein n=1 Tax=Geobacter pickeringii TaxID=345632 RepID=UPI000690DF69|nr:DUF2889 domain-containing protein [Geobacter pickeringii]
MDGFQRNITFSIGRAADHAIVMTATMVDRFHDLAVETTVEPDTLAIRAIRADFARSPTGNCRKIQARLDLLVGTPVGKGLTRKIFETLGGGEGCGNLRMLLLGSLPLAINARVSEGAENVWEMLDTIHHELHGTCVGYSAPPAAYDDRNGQTWKGATT